MVFSTGGWGGGGADSEVTELTPVNQFSINQFNSNLAAREPDSKIE